MQSCDVTGLRRARLGDVDLELVLCQRVLVEHADRLVGVRLPFHGHEGEAFRLTGAPVLDQIHRRDCPGLREQGLDLFLGGGFGKVSYVNSNIHFNSAFYPKGYVTGTAGNKNDRNPINGSAVKGATGIQLCITHSL